MAKTKKKKDKTHTIIKQTTDDYHIRETYTVVALTDV
jgi:hypothetical protein